MLIEIACIAPNAQCNPQMSLREECWQDHGDSGVAFGDTLTFFQMIDSVVCIALGQCNRRQISDDTEQSAIALNDCQRIHDQLRYMISKGMLHLLLRFC